MRRAARRLLFSPSVFDSRRYFSRNTRQFTTSRQTFHKSSAKYKIVWALGSAGAVIIGGAFLYHSPGIFGIHASDHSILKKTIPPPKHVPLNEVKLPLEIAEFTFAPEVPPPITRRSPALVQVNMEVIIQQMHIDPVYKYEWWSFNGSVPGPMIRARVGDVIEVILTNNDPSGMQHNIDLHAVEGPGGGAPLLNAETNQSKAARFKLTKPGLFIYHCAVEPIAVHIGNGMYGMILVEPEEGLPPVDHEFYIVQGEIYTTVDAIPGTDVKEMSLDDVEAATPEYIVFNGRVGSFVSPAEGAELEPGCYGPLKVKTGDRVRLYFGNAGPNLFSAVHIIGTTMKVWRDGDLCSPPGMVVQTTTVAPGSAAVIEIKLKSPGVYTLIDHSIGRTEKGAVGHIIAEGEPRPDIYYSEEPPSPCPGCKIHLGV